MTFITHRFGFQWYHARAFMAVPVSYYHFERIPGNIPGAYVSLESELIQYIKYHVNSETDKIKIKIYNLLCSLQCKKHFDLLMIMSNLR
jgi:hypothetical protein